MNDNGHKLANLHKQKIESIDLLLNDPRAQAALQTGWLEPATTERSPAQRVIARRLVQTASEQRILFEKVFPPERPAPPLSTFLMTIRAFSLTATLTPCLAIWVDLMTRGSAGNAWIGALALAGVLLFQIAINVFNDIEDYRRLIDLPGTLGGSGAIQNGWFTPRQLRRLAWTCLGLGVMLGFPAVLTHPQALLPIGVLALMGVLMYSGKKMGLKYLAAGDVTVFLLCGPVLTSGFSWALGQEPQLSTFVLGGYFGCLAMAILHVNNLQDLNLDRARGAWTLARVLGFKNSIRFLIALYVVAGLCVVLGVLRADLPGATLLGPIVLVIAAVPWLRSVARALGPESSLLSGCRVKAAQWHLLGGCGVIFGLVFGWVMRSL